MDPSIPVATHPEPGIREGKLPLWVRNTILMGDASTETEQGNRYQLSPSTRTNPSRTPSHPRKGKGGTVRGEKGCSDHS